MKTKIKLMALVVGLLSVLPMTSAWAKGEATTYYYGALKTSVSSTGGGKVYAATTKSAPSSDKYVATNMQTGQNKSDNKAMTFYAYAQANEGYEFGGWATSDGGAAASTDNPYAVSFDASSTTDGSPTVQTVYALFSKKQLAAFSVAYLPAASGQGSYTVDGAPPPTDPVEGLTEAYTPELVATPAANYAVKGWYTLSGGTKTYVSTTAKYTGNFLTTTSVGVDFVPVVPVTDYAGLRDALQAGESLLSLNADVEIPFGEQVTIPADAWLIITSGKTLVAKGKLINNGKISGGSIAHSYITVVQGKTVYVPWEDGTDGPEGSEYGVFLTDGTSGRYLKTSLKSEDSLSGSGTYDNVDKAKVFATIDNQASGEKFASKISTTKPKAVLCTVAREKAANWINGVVELGATVTQGDDTTKEVYTTFGYALEACGYSAYSDNNRMIVLLQDVTDGYKNKTDGSHSEKSGKLNASLPKGAVDCAGKKLTITSGGDKVNGNALVKCFNGAMTMSTKILTQKMMFYNCSGSIKICGSSYVSGYCFYDSPSMSVSYESSYKPASTSNDNTLNFYAGDYCTSPYTIDLYTSTKSTYAVVYSGTYKKDPSGNLYNSNKVEARQDPTTTYWTIFKLGGSSGAQVEVNGVECSLAQALENASDSGVTVVKVKQDIELTEDLVIEVGKDIQLNVSGWTIAGDAKIVNNGNLEIIDLSGNVGDERGKVNLPIENNGTLLLSEAIYNGSITLKGGKCHFIDGQFNGDIIVADAVADARAVAEVGGGSYAKTTYAHAGANGNLKDLCLDRGYVTGSAPNYLIANIPSSVVTYDREKSAFTLRAFDASDKAVFAKRENRGACTKEEWILARRLLSSVEMFGKWSVDCAVKFDRDMPVAGFSVTPAIFPMPLDSDVAVAANVDYSAFLQAQRRQGYAPFRYESFLPDGEHETDFDMTLACKSANKGTSCGFELRLANGVSIQSGPKDYSYETWVVIGTFRFVFGAGTNKAMLQPVEGEATFFTTLDAAVAAAETNGKTIKLCNDCAENVTVAKSCAIDLNGFEFTGSFVKGEGVEETVAGMVHTFVATAPTLPPVAKVGDAEYADIYDAMEAAQEQKATLVLLDDVTADVKLTPDWTLNLNGHQVIGAIEVAEAYKAAYWLKRVGDVCSAAPYVAQVGNAKYSSLANAINAAKRALIPGQTITVTLMVDCAESVNLPEGVRIELNDKALSGAITVPNGYKRSDDDGFVKADLTYVAKIGTETYATLGEAIGKAAEGATIRVVKDCADEEALTVAKECVIEAAKFRVPELTADEAAGYALKQEDGTYTFTCTTVACYGDELFDSLQAAVDAAVEDQTNGDPSGTATISLRKDCNEVVVVDAPCSFKLDLGDNDRYAFSGMVIAAGSVSVAKDGLTWTVVEVTDVPVDSAVVKVGDGLVEKVTEELEKAQQGTEPEAVQSALADKINTAYAEQKDSAPAGLAKVGTIVKTVDAQETTLKTIEAEMKPGEKVEEQETGLYQATKIITVDDEPVTVLDLEAKPQAVIKTVSKQTSLILAVPGDVTVDKVIKSGFEDGDTIVYYDGDKEYAWTYHDDVKDWVRIAGGKDAAEFTLQAGSAIRYVRDEGHTASVVVVADFDETREITVEVKADNWNVVANPNVEEKFDLDNIQPAAAKVSADDLKQDKIIVPLDDKTQRVYTYDGENWGYDEILTGYIGTIKVMKGKKRMTGKNGGDVNVDSGKGFWYYSGSANRPTIPWRQGKNK